ncbi:acyl-CoA dehydrogenase family protein [Flavobacterium sp. MAH-1]|uniref:acyl-CoA oxidase n=1 Tax=Flavobacterium agri TaxID=2743471 RepID=A0A7Y9C459_9FLAO|nr:acyl-CoA dehydrogenase [Flavobacterium agri]NUY79816.1 acyl-CoA dehydrogenase family protein [Flavobacterium agri]NYA69841.1 acyl-CoA dehydrogenase family protein [Flavobacterium agri]
MNKAFLPLFYLIWSDDLLTQKEFETVRDFISKQDWISPDDKKRLLSEVDVSNPPTRELLSNWKTAIHETLKQNPKVTSLYELSTILSGKETAFSEARNSFLQLESELGILGEEVLSGFRSVQDSLTSKYDTAYGFDVSKMTEILDSDEAMIIKRVKEIISRKEFAYETTTDIAKYREKVLQWCKILADENLGNMAFPKEYGGGGNMKEYFSIMETLSFHDLSLVIKFGVQFGLWGMSVYFLGTQKHHEKYLKKIGTLEIPGCFAMTETHHGSNVKGLRTTATYNHSSQTFSIHTPSKNDQKEYIGNAAKHGQMATVFAKLIIDGKDYGVNAFIVPIRNADMTTVDGVTIDDCGHKMGLNGVDNGTIRFDNVTIPKENMLDRFASVNENGAFESPIPSDDRRFFTMLGTLVGGRIGIPRSGLSAMKSGLTIAIRYSDRRRQFGPEGGSEVPILNYRMHQRRLMPYLAKSYALHFALRYLTDRFLKRTENEMQEIEALAAGMKAYTTWTVRDGLQECREAMGGKGYLSENRIDALKNDTEIYTTFEGDNTVLMQLVAKNRLSVFRKEFGKLDVAGMITYVFENAKTAVAEKNPIITRRTDEAHLLDVDFHLQAFQYREKTILASAARRLKKLIDSGMDAYDAFNVTQHQMIDVATAYLERVILEQFQKSIIATEDVACKKRLEQLRNLFALYQIEVHKGWYLEDGYMENAKTKAIRKLVNQLCWDIRIDAVPLVDAFAIPENCLGAEILKG